MFPDSSLTTSFSSPLCFFIRADVLWKLPRLTALWKTWGNFRASSPSVPQVFHRAFEIASRFQRAAWKTLRVSHSSHRTLLLDIYRPQDARNHNLPRAASGHATTILTQGVFESIATATSSRYLRMRSPPFMRAELSPDGSLVALDVRVGERRRLDLRHGTGRQDALHVRVAQLARGMASGRQANLISHIRGHRQLAEPGGGGRKRERRAARDK